MWYCDTDELPAIQTGKAIMKHADDEVFHLAQELHEEICAIKNGKITLVVQHCWVSCIDSAKRRFRKKRQDG